MEKQWQHGAPSPAHSMRSVTPRLALSCSTLHCWDSQLRTAPAGAWEFPRTMIETNLTSTDKAEFSTWHPHPATRLHCAAQEGAGGRVRPCRHSKQSIFSKAAEPGLCHLLPLLDRSDLHQLQMTIHIHPVYIQQRHLSLACRLRGACLEGNRNLQRTAAFAWSDQTRNRSGKSGREWSKRKEHP